MGTIVDGVRCVGVAQPVDRRGRVDAGALGRLLDDEIDGALSQSTARTPNGREHRRRCRRITTAGKEPGGNHRGDQHLPALTPLPTIESRASPLSRRMT
jgi:hypothetical protein